MLRILFGVWSLFMSFIPRQCWWLMAKIQTQNFSLGFCKLHGLSCHQPVMIWWKWLRWTREKCRYNVWIFMWGPNTNHHEIPFKCHVNDTEARKTTWYIGHISIERYIISYVISYHIISYHIIFTTLYYTLLYSTRLYSTLLYYTIPHHTIPYHTIPYHTILYYTILY